MVSFRLVYDKDTGKPKGFGFMEFADLDASASAVRNLNDYEIMGRRLRVDYSNDGSANDSAPANYNSQAQPMSNGQEMHQGSLPPLPPGADIPPNITCADAISRTLMTLPAPQLLDILSQMKGLVEQDAAKATELLRQAPQLAYAIFQALLLLGLVQTDVLGTIVDQASRPPVQQVPPPQPAPPVVPNFPPPMPLAGTPYQQNPYQQPPPAQQAPSQDTQALLRQVLSMPQHQIDALPPMERAQIMALRQQLMSGQGF